MPAFPEAFIFIFSCTVAYGGYGSVHGEAYHEFMNSFFYCAIHGIGECGAIHGSNEGERVEVEGGEGVRGYACRLYERLAVKGVNLQFSS